MQWTEISTILTHHINLNMDKRVEAWTEMLKSHTMHIAKVRSSLHKNSNNLANTYKTLPLHLGNPLTEADTYTLKT